MKRWVIRVSALIGVVLFLFLVATAGRIVSAGGEPELSAILGASVNGLKEFFKFLINALEVIW